MGSKTSLPAQTENGVALIEAYLDRLGVWTEDSLVLNGSGLSPTMQPAAQSGIGSHVGYACQSIVGSRICRLNVGIRSRWNTSQAHEARALHR